MLLYRCSFAERRDADAMFPRKRTTNDSIHNEMTNCSGYSFLVRIENTRYKGSEFYESKMRAILLDNTLPVESSLIVVKRNQDIHNATFICPRKDPILEDIRQHFDAYTI